MSRTESAQSFRALREEVGGAIGQGNKNLSTTLSEMGRSLPIPRVMGTRDCTVDSFAVEPVPREIPIDMVEIARLSEERQYTASRYYDKETIKWLKLYRSNVDDTIMLLHCSDLSARCFYSNEFKTLEEARDFAHATHGVGPSDWKSKDFYLEQGMEIYEDDEQIEPDETGERMD